MKTKYHIFLLSFSLLEICIYPCFRLLLPTPHFLFKWWLGTVILCSRGLLWHILIFLPFKPYTYRGIQLEVPILHFLWGSKKNNLYLSLDNKSNDYRLRVLINACTSPSFPLWGNINLTQNEANSFNDFLFLCSAQVVLFCRTDVCCHYKSFQFLMAFGPQEAEVGADDSALLLNYDFFTLPWMFINSEEVFPSMRISTKAKSKRQSPFSFTFWATGTSTLASSILTFNL